MIGNKEQTPPAAAPVPTKRLRAGGGSFDFLRGAYKESRRKSRQRFIALVAGSSIFALTAMFTGYQGLAQVEAQSQFETATGEYAGLKADYKKQTGQTALTRAQVQKQVSAAASSLKLAQSASVDVPAVLASAQKILPSNARLVALTVDSWTSPEEKSQQKGEEPAASPSPGASSSAQPEKPHTYTVAIKATMPATDVPLFEGNAATFPGFTSQTSTTSQSTDGNATTTLTIVVKDPLSPPALKALTGGGQ